MNQQISMDELLRKEDPPVKVEIPVARYENETVYTIPADVWEGRCRKCVHRNADENIPVPIRAVYKPQYTKIIPCRIMSISRPNDIPGECKSFAARMDVYGICKTCKHNSHFHEGFCMKVGHAPEHQIYIGQDYGRECYRHDLCGCDDYEPDNYVKEGQKKEEQP